MDTNDIKTMVVIAVLSAAILTFTYSYRKMIRSKQGRLSEREDMDPDRFYSLFYEDSGLPKDVVIKILETISTQTEMPISKLRPQDRFDMELKPAKGWEFDDGLGLLSADTQRLLEKNNVKVDLRDLKTIDDYIRVVAPIMAGQRKK